jgi:hypothetical protein
MDPWSRALATIDAAFAEPVIYRGAGLAEDADPVPVIWSDVTAPAFEGGGKTARTISCEIAKARLPQRPARSDRITRKGTTWAPNDVADHDTLDRWVLTLERAA